MKIPTTLVGAGLLVAVGGGCGHERVDVTGIASAIDSYHGAAAAADLDGYIGLMSPDGVFLGTDATERWTREEFRAFCEPYFSAGRGWAYVPRDRHISVGPAGRVAWFDEVLENEAYGTLRGSGVLTRGAEGWRIAQYNLTFLVPNDIAKGIVEQIRAFESEPPAGD